MPEEHSFRLRSDVQGRQLDDALGVSAKQVEEMLVAQIREWLAAPRMLLQLTCGDARFTILMADQEAEAPVSPTALAAASDTADDLVIVQSEESFPASDPPSSTGSAIGPDRA
jgi:hypothetical protein